MVIKAARKYIPSMASEYDNPRAEIVIGDGFEYVRQHPGEFDVIFSDSSDPDGPAAELFGENYYKLLHTALAPGGLK